MAKEAATPEPVNMTDGTVVEFTGKTRMKKTTTFDAVNVNVRFDFRNGEVRTFSTPHCIPESELGTDMGKLALKAMGHGLEQKLGDEASGVEDLEDAIEAIDQLMQRLATGYDGWTKGSEGGASMSGASVLAKAVAEATGQDITTVRAYLSNLTAKDKAALRLDDTIAPLVQRLEAEKAARLAAAGKGKTPIDTKALLAGVGKKPATSAFDTGAVEEAAM